MTGNRVLFLFFLGTIVLCAGPIAAQSTTQIPEVVAVGVPEYLSSARVANIEGDVIMTVDTDGERVSRVAIEPGTNVLLAEPAKVNVMTWRFAPHSPRSFQVTFRYRLSEDFAPSERVIAFRSSIDELIVEVTALGGSGPHPVGILWKGHTTTTRLSEPIDPSCAVAAVESVDVVRNPTLRTQAVDDISWTVEAMPAIPAELPEFLETPDRLRVEIEGITFTDGGGALYTRFLWTGPDGSAAFDAFARQVAEDLRDAILDQCRD